MLGKIEYAPNYGCNDTAARVAVEGVLVRAGMDCHTASGLCGKANPLDSLPTDGFIYLGSPYSLQADLNEAADIAEQAAALLMRRRHAVYAPIPHGHTIARHGLPSDWSFWKRQCEPFIDAASALVVLKLDGWRDSVGLTYEIARFHEAGKPIVYVDPEELEVAA